MSLGLIARGEIAGSLRVWLLFNKQLSKKECFWQIILWKRSSVILGLWDRWMTCSDLCCKKSLWLWCVLEWARHWNKGRVEGIVKVQQRLHPSEWPWNGYRGKNCTWMMWKGRIDRTWKRVCGESERGRCTRGVTGWMVVLLPMLGNQTFWGQGAGCGR